MRFVIRADATRAIGTGHVMRSCVIAEAAISFGIECIFVGDLGGIGWLEKKVKEIGFSTTLSDISNLKIDSTTDILILDTYDESMGSILDLEWLGKIVIVDPISPNFVADLRFHTGLESDWNENHNSHFYGSGEYILVRKELRKIRSQPKVSTSALEIMVTGGGSDPYNFCAELAASLKTLEDDFIVNFITDSPNSIPKDDRFLPFPIGDNFKNLLSKCNLIFSPASTTSLEMLTLGFPQGIVKVVKNQESNYRILTEEGMAVGIGCRKPDGQWELNDLAIENLVRSNCLRDSLSEKSSLKFDSLGSERMISKILDFYA